MCQDRSQRSGRERSDEMVTANAKRSATRSRCIGVVAALVLIGWSAGASAGGPTPLINFAASDLTGGYVVVPKVVVHTADGTPPVFPGEVGTDTFLQMSNTNEAEAITVDCWWVNANSHCGTCVPTPDVECEVCDTNADCPPGLSCTQGWTVTDFQVILTPGQPIGFPASVETLIPPCSTVPAGSPCQTAGGGLIRGVPEDPFRGELKCVQVDDDDNPVLRSDLKIEASIVRTTVPIPPGPAPAPPGVTTVAGYNGIGFATISLGAGDSTDPLCLGSLPQGSPDVCAANYAPCPGELKLDHFFDGARPEFGGVVTTDLTLVPCSEDLGDPDVSANFEVVAQFLVYNEFEQRFSTSTKVECYRATSLTDIDTLRGPAGDQFSIFAVGVEGTLTGQTRIRGVKGANGRLGYGLLGVACENYRPSPDSPDIVATTAFNLHHSGFRAPGDAVYITSFPQPTPTP
jgi:hypothetical protein